MRRLLLVLGALFLGLVLLVVGAVGYGIVVGRRLDRDAKAYVDQAVPAITAHWSMAELEQRAGPQLRKIKPADLRAAFVLFRNLGPLVAYRGCSGGTDINVTAVHGKVVTGNFVARAIFRNGRASIDILLTRIGQGWRIDGWHVNSSAMMQRAAKGLI